MFDHIVVPLDGSKLSEAALAYVAPLASRLGSQVVLLHADDDPYTDMFGGSSPVRDEDAQSHVSDYLRGVLERLESDNIRCSTHHEVGTPAAVILKYVEEHKPDLVAMSTHGRSGLRRMMVGSVTTTVLPRAQVPVLVVHPQEGESLPDTAFESIIVPLDMSSRSEEVLPLAAGLAETLGLETTVVTCIPSPTQMYTGSVPEVYPYPDDLVQQAQDASDEYLQALSSALSEGRNLEVQSATLEGGPASRIVECAQEQSNSLIAMCTQGRTGLGRWVLGSVTDSVIRTGNTPVLVVPHTSETD